MTQFWNRDASNAIRNRNISTRISRFRLCMNFSLPEVFVLYSDVSKFADSRCWQCSRFIFPGYCIYAIVSLESIRHISFTIYDIKHSVAGDPIRLLAIYSYSYSFFLFQWRGLVQLRIICFSLKTENFHCKNDAFPL